MITNIFGIPVKYEPWEKQNFLPLYIEESYKFYIVIIEEYRCIMLVPTEDIATIPALRKQIKRIQEVENVPVILSLSTVSFYRRKSLIENKIPFVTEKQVYLPFMGTFLINEKETERKEIKKFMFSTQQLVLLYFYNKKPRLYMSEATKKLPFTAMTLSRAVKQLETVELFMVTKDGVNKVLESNYDRWELFEKIKQYLTSPVRKVGYLEKSDLTNDMVFAGETALSKMTMLNPGRIETYAVYAKLFDKNKLMYEMVDPDKQICLELWEYDPKQFVNENVADGLSVALSLMGNADERVEEAVGELLERELRG